MDIFTGIKASARNVSFLTKPICLTASEGDVKDLLSLNMVLFSKAVYITEHALVTHPNGYISDWKLDWLLCTTNLCTLPFTWLK